MEAPLRNRRRKDPLPGGTLPGKDLALRKYLAAFSFQLNGDTGDHGRVADDPGRETGNWELATEDGAETITSAENEPTGITDARQYLD